MVTYQDLNPSQKRMIKALESWMLDFFCNDSRESGDSLTYALDNGFTCHAVNLMAGTGATDKRFDRIYSALVKSVGYDNWELLNRQDIASMLEYCTVQICPKCNHHAFSDDGDFNTCGSCHGAMPKKERE